MSSSGDEEIDLRELAGAAPRATEELATHGARSTGAVRRFRLTGVAGAALGREWLSSGGRTAVGSHESCEVRIDDPVLSRFHCELRVDDGAVWLRDLGSKNGSTVDGVPVREARLRDGSVLVVGRSSLRFAEGQEQEPLALSEHTALGSLVGQSVAMRRVFALMERAARSDVTVLIEGETGTGKEGVAESLHELGPRREGPFIIVDCSAMPPQLLESELFGHERGAFTGAVQRRVGAFEAAHRGTLFLDELGELPTELQPKLLRVLERKEIRRVGSNTYLPVDVRVVAATNRDLRARVNEGDFRADLYFRLAVLRLALPPLRERLEDVPLLVERFRERMAVAPEVAARVFTPELLARLMRSSWPGNVRELRNHLERCVVLEQPLPTGEADAAPTNELTVDPTLSYSEAKRRVLDVFERRYLEALLTHHGGNVTQAAKAAGMDRPYVYKLLNRHGLRRAP